MRLRTILFTICMIATICLLAKAADAPTIPSLTVDEVRQCDTFLALNTDYQTAIIDAQDRIRALQQLQNDLRTRVVEFNAKTLAAHSLNPDKYFVDVSTKTFKPVPEKPAEKK